MDVKKVIIIFLVTSLLVAVFLLIKELTKNELSAESLQQPIEIVTVELPEQTSAEKAYEKFLSENEIQDVYEQFLQSGYTGTFDEFINGD